MKCHKCGGDTIVADTSFSSATNTFYRKRKCIDCGGIMCTAETQVEVTPEFKQIWYQNYRIHEYRKWRRGPRRRNVKVRCLDTGEVYDSVTTAARTLGISRSGISNCCRGFHHTCGGYRWEYYKENEKE